MNRREFLASSVLAGPLLGGCLTVSDGGTTPDRRVVAVVDRDVPPDLPIRPGVAVRQPMSSDAGPPELAVTVENAADFPVEVGEERAIVFAYVTSQEPGLTLVPADESYEPVEAGCWRLAEPIAVAEYYGIISLAPGERIERQLGVWGSPAGAGCLPTGRFRFETEYAGARDREAGIDDQEWSGRWGFTLELA